MKQLREAISSDDVPLTVNKELSARLEKLESYVRQATQETLARLMQHQVESAVSDAGPAPFVIVYLSIPHEMLDIGRAKLSLIKATRHCPHKPILVLASDDGCLIGRCTVPQVLFLLDFTLISFSKIIIVLSIGIRHRRL